MKKTWAVWAIIYLLSLSILFELITDYAVLMAGREYYSNSTLSFVAVLSLNLDIVLSSILVYKLYLLRPDALLWTNIEFGYSTLRFLFGIIADALLHTGTLIHNMIEMLIVILIWWTLYNHLKRLLLLRNTIDQVNSNIIG